MGPLADRSEEELQSMRGYFGSASGVGGTSGAPRGFLRASLAQLSISETPEQFLNWTSLKTLTNVRDQGGCGLLLGSHSYHSAGQPRRNLQEVDREAFQLKNLSPVSPMPESVVAPGNVVVQPLNSPSNMSWNIRCRQILRYLMMESTALVLIHP